MPGRIQMEPGRAIYSMTSRVDIRCHQGKTPTGPQNPPAFPEKRERIVNMFDQMAHGYGIETIGRESLGLQASKTYFQTFFPRDLDSLGVKIHTLNLPSQLAHAFQSLAVTASDVQ